MVMTLVATIPRPQRHNLTSGGGGIALAIPIIMNAPTTHSEMVLDAMALADEEAYLEELAIEAANREDAEAEAAADDLLARRELGGDVPGRVRAPRCGPPDVHALAPRHPQARDARPDREGGGDGNQGERRAGGGGRVR